MTQRKITALEQDDTSEHRVIRYENFYVSAQQYFQHFISCIQPSEYAVTASKINSDESEISFSNLRISAQLSINHDEFPNPTFGAINFFLLDRFDDKIRTRVGTIEFDSNGIVRNLTHSSGMAYQLKNNTTAIYLFNYILNNAITGKSV